MNRPEEFVAIGLKPKKAVKALEDKLVGDISVKSGNVKTLVLIVEDVKVDVEVLDVKVEDVEVLNVKDEVLDVKDANEVLDD